MRACHVVLLSVLVLVPCPGAAQDVLKIDGKNCGMEGSAKTEALKQINRLKNRHKAPKPEDFDTRVSLAAMLAPGDDPHIDEAENTAPGKPSNWRATAWEIHPITSITVLPGPPLFTPSGAVAPLARRTARAMGPRRRWVRHRDVRRLEFWVTPRGAARTRGNPYRAPEEREEE